jgi:flagellar secretion chaperone FliS
MFGSMQSGAHAYAKVGLETGVTAASPHQLISMLFEGAIAAITNAVRHTEAREIEARGKALSKAIAIIENGLRASLNKDAGGSIAESLDALYQYMSRRLLESNAAADVNRMEEVIGLLRDLKQSWDAIGDSQKPAAPMAAPRPAALYDALAPRSSNLVKA